MLKKLHLRLTLLCAGITAVILIIMSFCYLYVSERGLYNAQFQAFQNDCHTITTNLEQQSVISMEWLSKMEAGGNYRFFVLDNGSPFLYNRLVQRRDTVDWSTILNEALSAGRALAPDGISPKTAPYLSSHLEYTFTPSATHTRYFGSLIRIGRNAPGLEIVVISPQTALQKQIRSQRLRFLLIDLAAILALSAFSFFFTGRLLQPVAENRQKQIRFFASASHELRTPLAVILSAAECLKSASASAPAAPDPLINTIRDEGMRMSSLIDDMLLLSEADEQNLSLVLKPVELDTLLMNCYESFLPLARQKQITLSIRLPESALLPCMADPDRIRQVLSILLHNAISYTPSQGRILLSLSDGRYAPEGRTGSRNRFSLSVEDSGIGISEEDKKHIFERFYRAEKARSTKGHFGLGLSIAYEIVTAHGGSIQVSDAAEGGTVFTVFLP